MEDNYRIIISRSANEEEVYITEEFDTPAEDYVRPGFELVFDEVRQLDLPVEFPTEYCLRKVW